MIGKYNYYDRGDDDDGDYRKEVLMKVKSGALYQSSTISSK